VEPAIQPFLETLTLWFESGCPSYANTGASQTDRLFFQSGGQ
jgi:hypothetical protein